MMLCVIDLLFARSQSSAVLHASRPHSPQSPNISRPPLQPSPPRVFKTPPSATPHPYCQSSDLSTAAQYRAAVHGGGEEEKGHSQNRPFQEESSIFTTCNNHPRRARHAPHLFPPLCTVAEKPLAAPRFPPPFPPKAPCPDISDGSPPISAKILVCFFHVLASSAAVGLAWGLAGLGRAREGQEAASIVPINCSHFDLL